MPWIYHAPPLYSQTDRITRTEEVICVGNHNMPYPLTPEFPALLLLLL